MLFYKVEGAIKNFFEVEDAIKQRREFAKEIIFKSAGFNQTHCSDEYYFVSNIHNGIFTIGVITEPQKNVEKTVHSYLKHIGYELEEIVVKEITFGNIQRLLSSACRQDFIDDDDEVLDSFGLGILTINHGRVFFGENLIEEGKDKNYIKSNAEKYLLNKTFLPELERIYAGSTSKSRHGHPVHYFLQTDDRDIRRETYKLLLQALYNNKRLQSKRYCFLDFKSGDYFSPEKHDSLYKACTGGAIVARFESCNDSEESSFASGDRDIIEGFCQIAKRYRNQVLTIICLPRECKKVKEVFYENLGTMSFVDIKEDFVSGEQAKDFLKLLAKQNKVRTDSLLFEKLVAGEEYLAPNLHTIFDEWYDNKLKTNIFPQYKELNCVKQEVLKATPKGCAYDELQEMVGLTDAKAVIQKALNYYKMKKLYEEKGLKNCEPAMHMVFTGNPGTAKTTAARLFARIMKDNGLLSRGQLVECGRGDLVGKYVGWTAQTVQKKFRDAMGGVLFIDEAYSLVDGNSGSYGDEAINTIVQEMENHREDVVVIFAGYPDEMERFLQKNPGLRSRIAFHVPFADYNSKELCKIATLMGKNKGVTFEDEALTKLETLFETACKQVDFGNGRYVRNIIEQAKMNQATRLIEYDFNDITTDEITTIKAVDIDEPEQLSEEKPRIGFAC